MGEQVAIIATLVASKKIPDLAIPQVPPDNAYSLLKTDSRQSSSSSIQIINGKMTNNSEITTQFYYILTPRTTGSFTFPALSLTIDGTVHSTDPITFSVSNEQIANPDVKALLILSRKELYPGEQSLLTFKVAQRVQSQGSTDVTKGFNGVLEKIDQAFTGNFALTRLFTNQVSTTQERIDGEVYNVFALRYLLFPLSSGSYSIGALPYEYEELRRASRRRSSDPFFDDFFGGGVQAVGKTVMTSPFTVTVKQLPAPPAGYSGAVGSFTISASASPLEVPTGESVTLKILFKGNTRPGNMSDVSVAKNDAYELFTPEKSMSVDTTDAGISTRKTYKYLLIPRKEGVITLPPVTFTYFDPAAESYKTATSETISLTVSKGKNVTQEQTRYLTQEEIREVGKDIRYIKTGGSLKHESRYAYRNPIFLLLFPLPFVLMVLSLLYRFQAGRRDQTMALQIRNKALTNALKQIATIKKQSSTLKAADLLGKIASVIETYISQKFGFAATGRTLDELKDELARSTADAGTVTELAALIEKIDSYRFGGTALDDASRQSILTQAGTFLAGLEKSVKKDKTSMKTTATALMLLCISATVAFSAPIEHWFDVGNRNYTEGRFDSAAVAYKKILESGTENSTVYFNYGNALFRLSKIGEARLAYERAALLNPTDADIAANIKFVESAIVDRVVVPERSFLDALFWRLHTLFTLRTQLWIAFIILTVTSLATSLSLFSSRNMRLWLIYLSVLGGLLFIALGSSIGYKIYAAEKVAYAIVLSPSIEAKNEPKGATVMFTAHEGTKFRIRKSVDKWLLVSLPNGVSGWVELKDLGKI